MLKNVDEENPLSENIGGKKASRSDSCAGSWTCENTCGEGGRTDRGGGGCHTLGNPLIKKARHTCRRSDEKK